MDELLDTLIREIVRHPDRSKEQTIAMNDLLKLIPRLPNIYKPPNLPETYDDAFNEALIGVSIYQNHPSGHTIRRFYQTRNLERVTDVIKVRRFFVRWFNRILKNQITEQWRKKYKISSRDSPEEYFKKIPFSIDRTVYTTSETTFKDVLVDPTISSIEQLIALENRQEQQNKYESIVKYLEQDPDNILSDCYPQNFPQSSCHELLKKRLLKKPPDKWKTIAQELNIPYGTVTAHWKKRCKEKILPKLANKLEKLSGKD